MRRHEGRLSASARTGGVRPAAGDPTSQVTSHERLERARIFIDGLATATEHTNRLVKQARGAAQLGAFKTAARLLDDAEGAICILGVRFELARAAVRKACGA